jgi:mannose-6-phosphate isomerase-like protein (cupin superfamily)
MNQPEPIVIHEDDCAFEKWDEPARGSVRWRTLISGDRTASDSLTVGVAELEPNDTTSLSSHRHPPAEVYYVLSGEGVVTISDTEYAIRPGTAVFIPGNASHSARNTGTEPLRFLYVFPVNSFNDVSYDFLSP